jgi:hypothetical protein
LAEERVAVLDHYFGELEVRSVSPGSGWAEIRSLPPLFPDLRSPNKPVSLSESTLIRIVQSYYDAVDSMDADRLSSLYLPAPSTTLQFNADPPIVTLEAIKGFSERLFQTVAGIKHSRIDIWTHPLLGDVVPVDLPPPRSSSTVTVVSTALPTFSIRSASGVTNVPLPATSIFTIDEQTEKFVSVHNMFDIAKVYAAM